MNNKVVILAIQYLETYWIHEIAPLIQAELAPLHPVVYVPRYPAGTGSLSEAINRGICLAKELHNPEYVWILTNVMFYYDTLPKLVQTLDAHREAVAVHPYFNSDHLHRYPQPIGNNELVSVPFIEFTAPLVRTQLLFENKLDEQMPYMGMDLDWGYRMRKAGHRILLHHSAKIDHTYIRNVKPEEKEEITRKRHKARRLTNKQTHNRLNELYGPTWKEKLWTFEA